MIAKFFRVFLIFFLFILSSSANSHFQHYDQLKRIEFDLYRNNKNIGKHIFLFEKSGDTTLVKSKINFVIKKLGITLYKYTANGTEVYNDAGQLIKFNSTTNQNGKNKFVNMKLQNNKYLIDGSSYKGDVPADFILGTWWNHSIIKASAQISAVSGRIIEQKVKFIGKETVNIYGKKYDTLHFNFSSSDKKLSKNKRLNTDIWYDENTLNWVKARFDKTGVWEYRLRTLEFF